MLVKTNKECMGYSAIDLVIGYSQKGKNYCFSPHVKFPNKIDINGIEEEGTINPDQRMPVFL